MKTVIANEFLDKFLPCGVPSFITVYLALLRLHTGKGYKVTVLADYLNMTESDVNRALSYWSANGVIRVFREEKHVSGEMNENSAGDIIFIEFLDGFEDTPCEIENDTEKQRKDEAPEDAEAAAPAKIIAERCPSYKTEEIDFYIKTNETLRKLFKNCEEYLGKLLTYNDMCVIFGMHDWLRMPIDVIDMLVSYCASNDRRSMRYIEKLAVTWTDAGIDTRAKAEARIKMYNGDFRAIMKELGKTHRDPIKKEEEYMIKWLKTYKLPLDVILLACTKTVLQAPRPGFKYCDGILEKWHAANVSSLEDIEKAEAAFKTAAENNAKTQKPKSKRSKFSNFTERDDIDFEKMRKLEMELIDMELGL